MGHFQPPHSGIIPPPLTAEADSESWLVDDGWHALEADTETEPSAVNGHPNGTTNTELEIDVIVDNFDCDETPDTQQSLFSWAEFMAEEPAKPSGRKGKPKPATLSMFEWALAVEQKRDEELVGPGR